MEEHTPRSWIPGQATGADPLFSERVERALAEVLAERDPLRRATRLRALLPADLAPRAAQLAQLRLRIAADYPRRPPRFASGPGLAMASREAVAGWRGEEIGAGHPGAWVLDATCGIGVDALGLAAAGARVVAADRDPFHARCAAHNLAALGFAPRVLVADAAAPAARADLCLLDPERRVGGERQLDPERWSPPLSRALAVAARFRGAWLKLAPALEVDALPLPPGTWRWRWISAARELVETALLGGVLAGAGDPARREVVALGQDGVARFEALPEDCPPWPAREVPGLAWLAEPDPALVRSGLLGALARAEGLRPLDARIAYLGGDRPARSGLLVPWRVLGSAPLDPKRVRALLALHDVGPLEVHKRGHSEPAEVLARRLAGPGRRRGVLFVARLDAGQRAFLVEPAGRASGSGPDRGAAGAGGSRGSAGVGDEGFEPPTSSL